MEPLMGPIEELLSTEDRRKIDEKFTESEVWEALKHMAAEKSPGSDGFPPLFYQKFWPIVGKDVTDLCLKVLNDGEDISPYNHTLIALIPKVKQVRKVSDMRPISLCSTVYKIISKTIANRLKTVLSSLISENQSAFVPGRMISDNILVAFELLHAMKNQKGRVGSVALKLDMSKAYDRVEWDFLRSVLERMGFSTKWNDLIINCISSVSYSVLINGQIHGAITPERGLRQGCPLSPYLFILIGEALSRGLSAAAASGSITGVSASRSGPKVTHLFFADDSLIFTKATTSDLCALLELLRVYEVASGQSLNFQKSSMVFSNNVTELDKQCFGGLCGMDVVKQHDCYLGLPTAFGRKKRKMFQRTIERVSVSLKGWKNKDLSVAGKEILIKAVAQSIPNYAMSCFLLPIGVCDHLEKLVRDFWWGDTEEKRAMHWVKWDHLKEDKVHGGLGFKDFHSFNIAMLAKQVWRILQSPDSLLNRVLRSKYHRDENILEAKHASNISYAFRGLLAGRDLLKRGMRWRVGTGENIRVFGDRWLNRPNSYSVITPEPEDTSLKVSHLIDNGTWNVPRMRAHLWELDIEEIVKIQLPNTSTSDSRVWLESPTGCYTVASGYRLHRAIQTESISSSLGNKRQWLKNIWSLKLPRKVSFAVWRIWRGSLPVTTSLRRRGVKVPVDCCFCEREPETESHLFMDCNSARQVWTSILGECPQQKFSSVKEWIEHIYSSESVEYREKWAIGAWTIWFCRNATLFRGESFSSSVIIEKIIHHMSVFQVRNSTLENIDYAIQVQPVIHWQRPSDGWVKLNCDAALWIDEGKAGLGWVLRDSDAEFVAGKSATTECSSSILRLEVRALKEGIQGAKDAGIRRLVVESDCSQAVALLSSRLSGSRSEEVDVELDEDLTICRNLLDSFEESAISHVKRSANRVAHLFASRAKQNLHPILFIEKPMWANNVILEDSEPFGF